MAGSFRSRFAMTAVLALAVSATTAVFEVGITTTRCLGTAWRVTWRWVVDLCEHATNRLARHTADWLVRRQDRYAAALVMRHLRTQAEPRRPLVSPRWRMCPSI